MAETNMGGNGWVDGGPPLVPGTKIVLSICVRDNIILSWQFVLRARRNGTAIVLADTLGIFYSSHHLRTDNVKPLDFSKRRDGNRFRFHTGVALQDMIQRIYFYSIMSSRSWGPGYILLVFIGG